MNTNPKGELIACLIASGQGAPVFNTEATGPAHKRIFKTQVEVGGSVLGSGEGGSKKDAERFASEEALAFLERLGMEQSSESLSPAGNTVSLEWPIYSQVLAKAIDVALEFSPQDATMQEVEAQAEVFYKGILMRLGHNPESGK